jgi:hypothetical protein
MPLLSIFIAFGLFSLSMFGHHRDSFSRSPSPLMQSMCYWGAWCCLSVSYYFCIKLHQFAYGSIFFFGYMTAAALMVSLILASKAKILPLLMGLCLILLPFSFFY